jgi:hypothetical protein
MTKQKRRKAKRQPPYYKVYRLETAVELEETLNLLIAKGFTIRTILSNWNAYTVVALMPYL